jgi:hypothetical protein
MEALAALMPAPGTAGTSFKQIRAIWRAAKREQLFAAPTNSNTNCQPGAGLLSDRKRATCGPTQLPPSPYAGYFFNDRT